MSVNIVQLITSQLGGGTVNKLSSLTGESPERTQSAVGAAVPALLAGFTQVASSPEGAQRLSEAARQQDPRITDNFAASIPSTQPGGAPPAGSQQLTNLLGGGLSGGISSALGRFTGMKSGGVSSLLACISPLALGVLGKQQKETGMDASGLSRFLDGQKQNISAAMPSGMGTLLGGIPGLGGFATPKAAPEPQVSYAGASPSYAGTTGAIRETSAARPRPSLGRWFLPLLIAAIVVWAIWAWSRHRGAQPVNQPSVNLNALNPTQLTEGLRNNLQNTTSTLGGITDASSAEQSIPQLNQLNQNLTAMKSQVDKLPPSAKSSVLSSVQPYVAKLHDQAAKVQNIPGAGEKLQPTLNQLEGNLTSLTTSNQ
jgi:hypothetical protein